MNLALSLHIAGAIGTLVLLTLSAVQLFRPSGKRSQLVKALTFVALFQLLTGAWLVVVTPGASLVSACLGGLVYLAVVGSTALMLKRGQRSQSFLG